MLVKGLQLENQKELKNIVKEKYGDIAKQSKEEAGGCGCGCGSKKKLVNYTIMSDDYTGLDGYSKDADLGLGCGLPTEYADLKVGDTVVDLGSGAGSDVFIASRIVGESGKVIGIDMTEEMYDLANENKAKLGFKNVEFKIGEIENLPLEDESTDVVISNCVLNLVPDKKKAFSEIYRILQRTGHFCVSDIVLIGNLPDGLRKSAEMYAGCVAGAEQKDNYLKIIEEIGFNNIDFKQGKTITIPNDILNKYLDEKQLAEYKNNSTGIFSITVVGYK